MAMVRKASLLILVLSCYTFFSSNQAHPISESPIPLPFDHPVHHPPAQSPHHHHHHHPRHHPHHHPPTHAPVYAPVYAPHTHGPIEPPSHPPHFPPPHYPPIYPPQHPHAQPPMAYPPTLPPMSLAPRSFIAVEGVVYCKSCKYPGVDTLWGATPIAGATVKLVCKNTKYRPSVQTATTDKKGYFFVTAPKTITSYAFHRCRVFLASSPLASCKKPSAINGGLMGGALRPEKWYFDAGKHPYVLYSVGPLAFQPSSCPR